MTDPKEFIPLIIEAALEAGKAIMNVYDSDDFDVQLKSDDSPLTRADQLAHETIAEKLKTTGLPILSEEGKNIPYNDRKDWDCFWMVDPLDGTKEFVKKNGEFTVNIALINQGKPILGVVYAPVLDKLYYGGIGQGAFLKNGKAPETPLSPSAKALRKVRIVASRSHLNADTSAYIEKFDRPEIVSMGSSLKFMLIAEGKADIYPRFAPTMEWDTAAAHAVLRAMEIEVINMEDDKPLRYNKENLLNPYFLVKK